MIQIGGIAIVLDVVRNRRSNHGQAACFAPLLGYLIDRLVQGWPG